MIGESQQTLLVNAIVGAGFPSQAIAHVAANEGLAEFTGNQHNEAWEWRRPALEALTPETLRDLYAALTAAKARNAH